MQDRMLRPVPIPLKQRWDDFRMAQAPVLTFLVLALTIGWMWSRYVSPSSIIGEVEPIRANIISVVDGTLQELKVDILQPVTNGQELAVLVARDVDVFGAELIGAEADLRVMERRMDVDKTRNLGAYAQLRSTLIEEQMELNQARVRLEEAEAEYERVKRLFEGNIVGRGSGIGGNVGLDAAKRDRDSLRAEVASHEEVTEELEASVERLRAIGLQEVGQADAVIDQAIAAQRERTSRLQRPIVLRSSIDGFVSAISNHPGESVSAGQPILVLSGSKSDRILAWMRQPVTHRPRAGDVLEVRRTAMGQPAFKATVVEVGSQMEPISPTLLPATAAADRTEIGLPMLVKADEILNLIPGEAVQLRLLKSEEERKKN